MKGISDQDQQKLDATKLLLFNKAALVAKFLSDDETLLWVINTIKADEKEAFMTRSLRMGIDSCLAEALYDFLRAMYLCYRVGPLGW